MQAKKQKKIRITTSIFLFLQTSWLLYVGISFLITKKYHGPGIFQKYMHKPLSIMLLMLGGLLLLCLIFLLKNKTWAWYTAFFISFMNFFLVPIGTIFSILCMMLLLKSRDLFKISHVPQEVNPEHYTASKHFRLKL